MTTNANYIATLNRGTNGFYTAQSAGAFNERSASGSFAAFVAFVIKGSYQQLTPPLVNYPEQWLWGNRSALSGVGGGWSITIERGSGGPSLFATMHDNSGLPTAFGLVPLGAIYERLVMFGLWYDGTNLITSVNGSIIIAGAVAGYRASALPARLGADSISGALSSQYIDFVAAGYSPVELGGTAGTEAGIVGRLAGESFKAFCEGLGGATLLDPDAGVDWLHRYNFDEAAAGLSSTTVKTAAGARVTALAPAPATLADVGNSGPVSAGPGLPVALTRSGDPVLSGRKNTLFFAPPFTGVGPTPQPGGATVNLYVSSVLGNDDNPGTETSPIATLNRAAQLIPDIVSTTYRIHLRNETYSLPSNAQMCWLQSRLLRGGQIHVLADEAWDPTVYTIQLAAAALAGTNSTTLVTAGLVVNAHRGRSVRVTAGAAAGQYRRINANSATNITVNAAFSPAAAPGDTFEIFTVNPVVSAPSTAGTDISKYLVADGMANGWTGQGPFNGFLGSNNGTVPTGLHFYGVQITGAPRPTFGRLPVFFFGVEIPTQIVQCHGTQLWSGQAPGLTTVPLEGWGVRNTVNSGLDLKAYAMLFGYLHSAVGFPNSDAESTVYLCGGFAQRILNGTNGFARIEPPAATPFIFEPPGGSTTVTISVPTAAVRLANCVVNPTGGNGFVVSSGAVLTLASSVTGAPAAGNAVTVNGTGRVLCAGAPVFGGAGTDWVVQGAAAFNKAALAAVGSAVVGTDGSVATRTA